MRAIIAILVIMVVIFSGVIASDAAADTTSSNSTVSTVPAMSASTCDPGTPGCRPLDTNPGLVSQVL